MLYSAANGSWNPGQRARSPAVGLVILITVTLVVSLMVALFVLPLCRAVAPLAAVEVVGSIGMGRSAGSISAS